MSQQILLQRKVSDAYSDQCSSSMRTHGIEASYAPLYKADVKMDIRTIESPFSQSLTISNTGTTSEAAAEAPKQLVSPFTTALQEPDCEAARLSSKEVMNAKIDKVLHSKLSAPNPALVRQESVCEKRPSGIVSAHNSLQREDSRAAVRSALKNQRSSSLETGRSKIWTLKSNAQGKEMSDDLQAVLQYNLALQVRTLQLEKKLAVKDREVAALSLEMQMLQPRDEESPFADRSADGNDGKAQSLPVNLLRAVCSGSALEQDAQLLRLRKFFDAHLLHEADATGKALEEGVMKQLRSLIREGCEVAAEMLTPPSGSHHMLPLTILEHSAALPDQAALWLSVSQKLQLSVQQKQNIKKWRTSTLGHLQLVQKHRHYVLSQMMHLMLPGGMLLHADAPKQFCSKLQTEGTLPLMKVNMDVSSAAKRLEENLGQERKLFAEANTYMLQTILSPVQAGLLMLDAWPAHCDCFAFSVAAAQDARG